MCCYDFLVIDYVNMFSLSLTIQNKAHELTMIKFEICASRARKRALVTVSSSYKCADCRKLISHVRSYFRLANDADPAQKLLREIGEDGDC